MSYEEAIQGLAESCGWYSSEAQAEMIQAGTQAMEEALARGETGKMVRGAIWRAIQDLFAPPSDKPFEMTT